MKLQNLKVHPNNQIVAHWLTVFWQNLLCVG